jgi:hypothetical protein
VVDAVRLAVLFELARAVDAATTRAAVRVAAVDAYDALTRVRHARAQRARPLTNRWRHLGWLCSSITIIVIVVLSRDLLRRRRRASRLAVRTTSSWHWWQRSSGGGCAPGETRHVTMELHQSPLQCRASVRPPGALGVVGARRLLQLAHTAAQRVRVCARRIAFGLKRARPSGRVGRIAALRLLELLQPRGEAARSGPRLHVRLFQLAHTLLLRGDGVERPGR